jgi:60Kd inner membrane protein
LQSKIETLRREHGDNSDAFQHAMMEIYEENQVRPNVSCLPALAQLPLGFAIEAPALWAPSHQGLPDKLAGTIIISDR